MKVLIIGSGNMAIEYTKVLNSLKIPYTVIARKKKSLNKLQKSNFSNFLHCNISNYLKNNKEDFTHAIIATSIDSLKKVSIDTLSSSINNILIEKPGGINLNDLIELKKYNKNKKIFIAYNRRFLSSVMCLKKIIRKTKIESVFFSFNEQSKLIEKLKHPKVIKENWVFANSSHIIDLVFFIIGIPKKIKSFNRGHLSWHNSSIFKGFGISNKNIPFSYATDWKSPGRWTIEIMTKKRRYILSPLEKIQYMDWSDFNLKELSLNSDLDSLFKPGLYLQVKNFLNYRYSNLCDLNFHIKQTRYINKIAGY